LQIRFIEALEKLLARQVHPKAANGGKLSGNVKAEYSPGSFRCTDIMCVDEILDLIEVVFSGVNDRVLSAVRALEEVFPHIHKDANSQGDTYVNMTIHKVS